MTEAITHKEKVYKILKKTKTGIPLPMTPMAQKIGCTLSHLSIIFRMAKEAEFLGIHDRGDYIIKEMPDTYEDFKKAINEKTNKYRKEVKGTSRPKKKGFSRPPKEVNINNILSVIDDLIKKSVELEQLEKKYASLIKFTKKLKKRLDSKRN
jgi:uncharacterized protein YqgV (UPF0045/DUF77 family)